ncbi:MAG: hypothetical protein HY289_10770 [Planctomycetes bacterium]|nr:hypothetical protein [Planctomycetota bacterium]
MKKMLLGLFCVAFAGAAYAQEVNVAHEPMQPTTLQQVSSRLLARGASCNSPCPPACPQPCKVACAHGWRPPCPNCLTVPAQKVEKHICYSSVCEKICFRAPSSFLHGGSCEQNCEHRSYTQKYLVKKVTTTVTDTYKCVPANPNCDNCRSGILHSHHQPGTIVEPIPVKPMPPARK